MVEEGLLTRRNWGASALKDLTTYFDHLLLFYQAS